MFCAIRNIKISYFEYLLYISKDNSNTEIVSVNDFIRQYIFLNKEQKKSG